MIGLEVQMIGRALLDTCFIWDRVQFHGHLRSNLFFAQSTVEAEYIEANAAVYQAIWLKRILIDLNERQEDGATIYCDTISSIALSKNPVF